MLQWGHGISAVEFGADKTKTASVYDASMGPRHFSRGILVLCIKRSMHCSLQWGHGISAVELSDLLMYDEWSDQLQWGHGISAVEFSKKPDRLRVPQSASMGPRHFSRGINPAASGETSSLRSFNGATAFQPWN